MVTIIIGKCTSHHLFGTVDLAQTQMFLIKGRSVNYHNVAIVKGIIGRLGRTDTMDMDSRSYRNLEIHTQAV